MAKITIYDNRIDLVRDGYGSIRIGVEKSDTFFVNALHNFLKKRTFSNLAQLMNTTRDCSKIDFNTEIHENYFFILEILFSLQDAEGITIIDRRTK